MSISAEATRSLKGAGAEKREPEQENVRQVEMSEGRLIVSLSPNICLIVSLSPIHCIIVSYSDEFLD